MRFRAVRTGLVALVLALAAVVSPLTPRAAAAADLVPNNRGFENQLTGWTTFSAFGSATATTELAYAGAYSAKLVDTSAETSTGLESTRLAAAAGRYAAVAKAFVVSGNASLYLRFYNSSGTLVGNHYTTTGGTTGGAWETMSVSGTAPSGTATASVLVYSAAGNVGTSYFDDVSISKGLTNLGVQINNSMVNGTTFGLGAYQNRIFGVFTGSNASNPPRMATIDADTERVVGSTIPLTGATGAWGATTATDGSVYFGSYSNTSGSVYRHVPGSTTVTNLGQPIAGQTFVWCLTAGADGRVYGGTYKSGGYFKYEPANGFTTLGSTPIWPEKDYVRAIAFDEAQGATYLGVGTNAALIRFDRVTGAKQDILPAKYAGNTMIGGLTFTGGRLFAVMASGSLSVLNIVKNADGTVEAIEEAADVAHYHVSPARGGIVYVLTRGELRAYDIAARTFTSTGITTQLTPTRFGWVRLADPDYPGETLVMVGTYLGRTYLFKYNPANGATRTAVVTGAPVQPTDLHSVGAGPDGKVYTGGYLTGGTGVYHPLHGDANDAAPDLLHHGMTQTDSILSYQSKVYFGTYSGARIYEYDPASAWGTGNPRLIATLSTQGQDRPYTMAAGEGKLFVGTVPKYGAYDGALSIIDLTTGQVTVKRNIVADQGVVAVAYHGAKVYGGTTIRGGLGVDSRPRAIEAKFFAYDIATDTKTEYSLTLPGGRKATAITALAVVDGRIWGMAEGYLFVFNPATGVFSTAPVQKFSAVDYRPNGIWRDAAMAVTPKDTTSVYITIAGTLYRINKSTLAVTELAAGAHGIAVDRLGDIYFYNDVNLYRYLP